LLCSSKAIREEAAQVATRFGRPSPDPGFSWVVKLYGSDLHGSLNLISVGEALGGSGITAKEAPPALLEIELGMRP
jgi:hypothetical protein